VSFIYLQSTLSTADAGRTIRGKTDTESVCSLLLIHGTISPLVRDLRFVTATSPCYSSASDEIHEELSTLERTMHLDEDQWIDRSLMATGYGCP
jgi:hypothetical protein